MIGFQIIPPQLIFKHSQSVFFSILLSSAFCNHPILYIITKFFFPFSLISHKISPNKTHLNWFFNAYNSIVFLFVVQNFNSLELKNYTIILVAKQTVTVGKASPKASPQIDVVDSLLAIFAVSFNFIAHFRFKIIRSIQMTIFSLGELADKKLFLLHLSDTNG